MMILVGAFLWSLYAVLAAPLMHHYTPLRVTALTTAIGAVPLILLGLPTVAAMDMEAVDGAAGPGFSTPASSPL